MKKNAQTIVEYMLIFVIVAIALFYIQQNVNFKSIKNYVFMRPADATGATINIESMTGGNR